jgi:hypothetical protein
VRRLFAPAEGQLWPRWLYLRILGVGFAAAFLSLSTQLDGLIGPRGILSASEYLKDAGGFFEAPSLVWLNAGPVGLAVLTWGGLAAALLLVMNVWPRASLAVCFVAYLSFVTVAQDFSGFQSDGLMLESALLGLFLAPPGRRPGLGAAHPPSRAIVWLFRWLCFRLMFESGVAKLASGDESWRSLTAMDDYYENCPFPTVIGWWLGHLPHAFHAGTVLFTFVVELVCPFLIFAGRWGRRIAFAGWALLQLGILLGANYTFLNYNSIALGLFLLDDPLLVRVLRRKPIEPVETIDPARWRMIGATIGLSAITYLGAIQFVAAMGFGAAVPRLFAAPVTFAAPFRVANRYALFASMTHERNHIEFEGTRDGVTWRTYRFRWQPQALDVRPRFMAPHLPRFDWNLWFAVLGHHRQYPLVVNTAVRLIEGSPSVVHLFADNPFPEGPPARIRFPLSRYHFTDVATWRATGAYCRREPAGVYAPEVYRDEKTGEITMEDE